MAKIVICADDYGLSPGVGLAVRELIAAGRLTATSAMTVSDYWPAEAILLKPLAGRCDIGLHLTLTDQRSTGPMPGLAPGGKLPSLVRLMMAAFTRRLDRGEVEAEIERQIDRFEATMGFLPQFVDGHHHVHQLPVVRDALLAVYDRRLRGSGAWIRSCVEPLSGIVRRGIAPARAALIGILGRPFARSAREANIPINASFRGVRSFTAKEDWPRLMAAFVTDPPDGLVIMCHPAIPDEALAAADYVVEPRRAEYEYLRSEAFPGLLAAKGATLVRLRDWRNSEVL
ncbi:MAG: ChbG/HpnK family deacetylase [Rhodospirillales bacterium]|nr:ChbG/HpnK family deacetylase [Rhodospirillales bacterium]